MDKRKLPDKMTTTDLIAGECDIPALLKTFYQTILRGYNYRRKNNSETELRSESLASDLIYATTRGRIKPSKQIVLGMAMKSLTSSKKVLNIINKLGHCVSYSVVEELETEAAYTSTSRSLLCPSNITLKGDLHTGVAFDNFDRFVETATGKQTLHDTVGIIYQDICEDNDGNAQEVQIQDAASRRKRRRTFDVIMPDVEPIAKKLKYVGQLQPVDLYDGNVTPANLKEVKMIDAAWMISHALNIKTPMWVGFNAKLLNDTSKTQEVSYLPPINLSPTDPSVVMETMKRAIQVADEYKQKYIPVTYDLAIAKMAMQLQSMHKDDFHRLFIHLGPFHIEMSYLKAVGSFIENCGLTNVMVESGLLAAGSVGGFLSAKNFNRAKRLHVLVSLSLKMEHFKFFLRKKKVQIRDSLIAYLKTLPSHGLVDDTIDNAELRELIEQYLTFKEKTLAGLHGKTPQYYTIYMNLIDHYLMFSRSIRTGDFELMKYVLPKINNIFFPFNHVNYARWLIRYCDNLMKVAETHPDLFEDFKAGYLGIKRTSKTFSRQGADLVVEQTINADAGKTLTGITHFTNSIKARMRWTVDFALRAEICANLLELVGLSNVESITNDLKEDRINRSRIQIAEFISGLNVRVNPFDASLKEELLYNIATGEAAPKEVELFLTSVESTGHEIRINMINSCAANEDAFQTYTIKKTQIKNFTSVAKKRRIRVGEKVTEVKIQKDLFGRLLGISIKKKIDIGKVLTYPLTPVPLSMCHIEGIIHKTDKAVLTTTLEATVQVHDEPQSIDIKVVDGFFLFHAMNQVPAAFGNVSLKYLSTVCSGHVSEVVVAFDEYREPSIKATEHALRDSFSSNFLIHGSEQVRPSNFSSELRNDKFKTALVKFLLQHWMSDDAVDIIGRKVVYVNFDKCYKYIVENGHVTRTVEEELSCCGHEEADTKMIYHLCQVQSESNVVIQCSDTDVLVIMLANMCNLKTQLHIWLRFGTGNTQRYINVNKIHDELGDKMCRSLAGLHAMTGCDYTPAFYRKGKKKPFQILLANEEYQDAFINMFEEREESFSLLEEFVCRLYGYQHMDDVNEVRLALFLKYSMKNSNQSFEKSIKNFDASLIPPCKAELFQQLMRVLYVSNIWCNAHLQFPSTFGNADGYGWKLSEDTYSFHWFNGNAMPITINEIVIENLNGEETEQQDNDQPNEDEETLSSDEDTDDEEEEDDNNIEDDE